MTYANNNNEAVDVYIVSTPRHWLIATALAFARKEQAILLIDNTFSDVDNYIEVTTNWEDSPFVEVVKLFGKVDWMNARGWRRNRLKSKEQKNKRQTLKLLSSRYKFINCFTSSVRDWFCQYAVFLSKESGDELSAHYIDDGARTYLNDISVPKKSILSAMGRRLTYGFWYQYPESYHATAWLRSALVFHPSIVNSDIGKLTLERISPVWFTVDAVKMLHHSLFESLGFGTLVEEIHRCGGRNVFFVFTKLDLLYKNCANFKKTNFQDKLYENIEKALKDGCQVWVKYHPREESRDVFDLVSRFPRIRLLPNGFAFDLVMPYLGKGDSLIGDMSTVLLDVALQRPMVNVVSLDCLSEGTEISTLFLKAGVQRA